MSPLGLIKDIKDRAWKCGNLSLSSYPESYPDLRFAPYAAVAALSASAGAILGSEKVQVYGALVPWLVMAVWRLRSEGLCPSFSWTVLKFAETKIPTQLGVSRNTEPAICNVLQLGFHQRMRMAMFWKFRLRWRPIHIMICYRSHCVCKKFLKHLPWCVFHVDPFFRSVLVPVCWQWLYHIRWCLYVASCRSAVFCRKFCYRKCSIKSIALTVTALKHHWTQYLCGRFPSDMQFSAICIFVTNESQTEIRGNTCWGEGQRVEAWLKMILALSSFTRDLYVAIYVFDGDEYLS